MSTPVGEGFRGPEGRIGYLLRQAHQAMRTAIDQAVREIGITAPQYSLLSVIRHEPGLSGIELATDSMLTQQTTSEIIRALERQRLVERRPHPSDRRARLTYLTSEGEAVLTEGDRRVAKLEQEAMRAFGKSESRQVAAWLVSCAQTFEDRQRNGRRRAAGRDG